MKFSNITTKLNIRIIGVVLLLMITTSTYNHWLSWQEENEKNIKLSNFFYELLNTNYDNLEREFKDLGLDNDKIVFKINTNSSNIVMLFPKNKDKPLKYSNYYIAINFNDEIKIKYVVDEEELLDEELKLISSINPIVHLVHPL